MQTIQKWTPDLLYKITNIDKQFKKKNRKKRTNLQIIQYKCF